MSEVLVKVPQLSESVSEATVLAWRVAEGDVVAVDDVLVEIETDKVIMEVPAPAAGVVGSIAHRAGEAVKSDEKLCTILKVQTQEKEAEKPAEPIAAASRVMPSAAVAAQAFGVNAQELSGTGPCGS